MQKGEERETEGGSEPVRGPEHWLKAGGASLEDATSAEQEKSHRWGSLKGWCRRRLKELLSESSLLYSSKRQGLRAGWGEGGEGGQCAGWAAAGQGSEG